MSINLEDPFENIDECPEHSQAKGLEMEEDCTDCLTEFQAKQEVVSEMAGTINPLLDNMRKLGMDPTALAVMARLEVLVESVLGPRSRVAFEAASGVNILGSAQEALRNAARQQMGVKKSGLYVPGQT